MVIATKFGFKIDPNTGKQVGLDSRPEHIEEVADASLEPKAASSPPNGPLSKRFTIVEGKTLELRVSAYNPFNQVRRTTLNSSVQYKAQGATAADGFYVYNTPAELAPRAAGTNNAVTIYNQYRSGVGYINLTGTLPMRIMEVALKFRF